MTKKKNFRNKAFIILFVSLLFTIIILNDPFNTQLNEKDVVSYSSQKLIKADLPDTLKIMTWNIKFGGGRIDFFFDCYGDRVIMTKNEVIENLENLVLKIQQYKPDILFLQEVDINSKRSAGVDQLQWLLDNSELNFGVYASQWKANYIPSDGIGRINSGNAILSKWEMSNSKRIGLPLFDEHNFIVKYFYLKRNILTAEIDFEGNNTFLVNTHLTAYSHDGTKKKQLDILNNLLESYDSRQTPFIVGGDFNSVPPE
ncbi:MAG: endonuclease/exonuclease/phosphatase family protein, partial [Bacteroidota bacterium]|nr:endonuclease/exonuclease/phosphatase family protein [Bacteroidota bacterium]